MNWEGGVIGVDWGTSSFRAFRMAPDGTVLDRRHAPRGILQVPDGAFGNALTELVGDWLAEGESRILLSGMIGSRQGWREAPYLACPAGLGDLARSLTPVAAGNAQGFIVPGLIADDDDGVTEIMRGEETQILGVLPSIGQAGIACLPGSHSKWARIEAGRIAGFTTAMTGETFAALRDHTILGRLMTGDGRDAVAFDAGLARSQQGGGLLHHIFGARTLVIAERLSEESAASYLSGLLIGHDVWAALTSYGRDRTVHLIGEESLCRLYGRALAACGMSHEIANHDAAALGLTRIGELAPWT
jgi:2-dehydro-3-deoxygalactonokinase